MIEQFLAVLGMAVIMVGNDSPPLQGHAMYVQQFACSAGIFGGQHIRGGQNIKRAQGNIARRA